MVDRFWSELEWDFQRVLHLDAGAWLRGEKDWRQFIRFAEGLPQGSKYWAKKYSDKELAQELWDSLTPEQRKVKPAGSPSLEGWTDLKEDLAAIKDNLILVRLATGGGDARSVKFTSRPVPAFEQIRREYKTSKLNSALGQLLPHDPTYKENS
ncbi:hypothetical protein [Tsukamurella paurometabola]|uniref:Uncharacterized protein n=1 Tax=Tsukamurella paurometabola TaxID=2061 RepID=A0ABS5NG51_TSUPA|nr:hypothetical protein [Tsukamurella paurometabola]MBS4103271.1 hypothetical protein [Tsukamurella paurometabola]